MLYSTRKLIVIGIVLFLPFLLVAQSTKKVMVIGIDGCRPDALEVANTPNIDNLIANGVFSSHALNDDVTSSGPGWSANLCGVWSDKHLVTTNNFSGNNYAAYPHVYKHIEDFDSDLLTASICHWAPINNAIVLNHADYKLNVSSDASVATQAVTYLSQNDPDVMFLHFDDVDHAGHAHGYSPTVSEYVSSIEGVDVFVGTVLQAIVQRPFYGHEDWLIVITTDHGGLGFGHGGNSFEEKNVFFVASGDNIVQEVLMRDSTVMASDVINCLADTTELTFDGADDNVQIATDPLFDFGSTQDFTIECRVRTTIAADVAIVGNKNWNSGVSPGFVFSFKFSSGPEWKVNIGDGSSRVDINTGGEVADGLWHTLSVSFDRDGFMKMYQDGSILDSTNISAIGNINTGQGLFFGTDINGNFDYTGSIAEVRVWNTVIDRQDISDWQCTHIDNSHPSYADLIGYWKLDEGDISTQAMDYTANGNDGIINGAEWTEAPDSIVTYDYSNTPRLTDIVPTVLAHLGIPIEASWLLDGIARIPVCLRDLNWIGLVSTDWDNPGNWTAGILPGTTHHVIVPASTPFQPTVNIDATIGKITLTGSASVNVATGVVFEVIVP